MATGNQALDTLATLCSGHKDSNNISSHRSEEASSRTNPNAGVASAAPSSSNEATTALLMKQAAERLATSQSSDSSSASQQQQQQQWAQALLTAQRMDPSTLALLLGAQQQQQQPAPAPTPASHNATDFANAVQQLAVQQYLQSINSAAAQQQQQQQQAAAAAAAAQQHAALLMAAHLQQQQRDQQQQQRSVPSAPTPATGASQTSSTNNNIINNNNGGNSTGTMNSSITTLPPSSINTSSRPANVSSLSSSSSMKDPSSTMTTPAPSNPGVSSIWNAPNTGAGRILPNGTLESSMASPSTPAVPKLNNNTSSENSSIAAGNESFGSPQDKKSQKRAANRRSAQLSRKRKKQFIEELKEENDDLKRKEQILRAIPDLIVVFDSSGKLAFVSESVGRFIDVSADELIGTSFWDRLCEDSVRLLKAAFMDSLAARQADSDTAPLGDGVWELRLIDKNNNYLVVTLSGVVHFKGDVPECVCCIRPQEGKVERISGSSTDKKLHVANARSMVSSSVASASKKNPQSILKSGKTPSVTAATAVSSAAAAPRPVSGSDGSRSSDGSGNEEPQVRINPRQSVVGNKQRNDMEEDDDDDDDMAEEEEEREQAAAAARKRIRRVAGQIVNISDGDSVEVSESGSDDGVAST